MRYSRSPLPFHRLLLLSLVALPLGAFATDWYITPTGAGAMTGTSWATARPRSQLSTTLNSSMAAGDTLYLGSGNYLNSTMGVTSSGTSTAWKRVIGRDTGGGLPVFDSADWSRTLPEDNGNQDSVISIGASYWSFENLVLRSCEYAVKKMNTTDRTGLYFKNIAISNVRHGFYMQHADGMVIEDCSVRGYSKHGFRLDRGCNGVEFTRCVADLTDGDVTWWDYSEAFPYGFLAYYAGLPNTDISFTDCVAANNRRNNQGISYWNGDGFVVEGNSANVSFLRCISLNNEDAGYDVKAASTFDDCVSVRNYRGYRLWDVTQEITNCVATFPFRRSTGNPTGAESGSGVWVQDGHAIIDRFTFHANNGGGLSVEGGHTGTGEVTNSILSFTGAAGTFANVRYTLDASTVTYRPGAGVDPQFVAPSASWDGIGDDMNSITYGATKGYYSGPVLLSAEADTYVHDQNPNTNYGNATGLFVKSAGAGLNRISYLRFAVPTTGTSATLKLKVTAIGGEGSGNRTIQIRQLTDDTWSETGMTWSTRASSAGTLIGTITNAGTVGTTYSVDVTSYVNAEAAGDGVASFVLVQPANGNRNVTFGSSESAGNEPVLELQQ